MHTHRNSRRRSRFFSRRGRRVGPSLDRRLRIETLEDRRMLAVITVTSSADDLVVDGMVTLREAIQAANTDTKVDGSEAGSGIDGIKFSGALSGQTIKLNGELQITEALTIDATALANNITVNAQNNSRIFNITATTGDFTFAGLTLSRGRTTGSNANSSDTTFNGGAVRSLTSGNLTIDQSTITGSSTEGGLAHGGGIFSFSDVTLTSSTVSGNSTVGYARGGGIRSLGDVTLTNSTVSGNSTAGIQGYGGGIFSSGAVTLTNSTVSGNSTTNDYGIGGGIRSSGAVTLTNSNVSGNSTAGKEAFGGGVYSNGAVTLTNSTVSGNSTAGTSADGGGILSHGDVTLTGSTVSGNSTTNVFADGGGIFSAGTVRLTSSTVSGNSTTGNSANGGGIRAYVAVTLTDSTVSGNFTEANGAVGGGIWAFGDVTLTSSTVSGNSTMGSHAYGGGIFSERTVALTSSTVSGNSTAGGHAYGGGILALRDVTLTSSTVSGNSTTGYNSHGGGIRSSGDVTLTNSTVTDNHANDSNATGGGIWNNNDTITITNSIVADNTAGSDSPDIRPGTGALAVNYSLLGKAVVPDAGGSGNLFNNSPRLGVLTDNGGPTETHALLSGSLAIDAGDPSFASPPDFDQRGAPFVRVSGGRIDIGAVEVENSVPSLEGDYDADGFVGQADLDLVLLNWGETSPPVPAGWVNQIPTGLIGQAALDGALLHWGDGTPPIATLKSGQSAVGSRQEVPANLEVSADLIDAVMAIELFRSRPIADAPTLDEEPDFAETLADRIFAVEAITPAVVFADEAERPDTDSNEGEDSENPWLADELLEQVFG